MDLLNIQGISRKLAWQLDQDGWTISKLATAAPARLEQYPGVDSAKAKSIVELARAYVNRQGELEAQQARRQIETVTYVAPPATSPLRESERIRRIREGLKR